VHVVAGGRSRQQSVSNGVRELSGMAFRPEIIMVHDAARPFMPAAAMREAIGVVEAGADGVVPVVPLVDTLVAAPGADGTISADVDRDALRAAQTPQVFRAAVLIDAHAQARADEDED